MRFDNHGGSDRRTNPYVEIVMDYLENILPFVPVIGAPYSYVLLRRGGTSVLSSIKTTFLAQLPGLLVSLAIYENYRK